jgi:signal transduction histidine kinase
MARGRAEQLQQLTAALSLAATPADVADVVIDLTRLSFDAVAGVVVARRSLRGDTLDLMRASDMPEEIFQQWRSIPLSVHAPLSDVVRQGTAMFLESPDEWRALYPELLPVLAEAGHQAQMVAPLIVAGRCIGAMGVAFREPRTFTDEEREFLMSMAGQCAIALERARLYEAEKEARTAAELANKAKGDFLAAMSHELRTPLNAIAGHVDLLALDIYGPTSAQQQDALKRVKRAQQHLLGIINDLLGFARLERGHVEFQLAPVRLHDVVDDVAPMIGPQMAVKNLEYTVKFPTVPVEVVADRSKLAQIVLNLLTNAVKFTNPGGRVSLEVRETPASDTVQKQLVEVSVTDTGIGIPPDKLEAVFDPFVQLATDPANRRQGTGLGLAISRDLARGMGGELTARSTPGVSTTFTLNLVKSEP